MWSRKIGDKNWDDRKTYGVLSVRLFVCWLKVNCVKMGWHEHVVRANLQRRVHIADCNENVARVVLIRYNVLIFLSVSTSVKDAIINGTRPGINFNLNVVKHVDRFLSVASPGRVHPPAQKYVLNFRIQNFKYGI